MKIKKSKIFIITILELLIAICIAPMMVFATTEIGDVDIEGVTFNYDPGDAPKATAYKCDPWDEQYDIEYEYWEEMETNAKGESVPIKYWYSDESKNNALAEDKKITTFEDGKTYMYSISLKAKEGNTFAINKKVMVNGANVNSANITNSGTRLFIVAIKTIKPKTITYQHISIVEINNATISFKVGDKPVFSGKTPDNAPYIYQSEYWSTDGGKKYYYAADFWNINNPDDLFTKFESGKFYTYGIYFKAAEGYCFTTDTKLKINGKYYDYDTTGYDSLLQYPNDGYATMWVNTNLTITPTSTKPEQTVKETVKEIQSTGEMKAKIEFAKEISKDYKLDIKPVEVKKDLTNKNVKYVVDINVLENGQIVKISDTKMKIKIALPEELKGYNKYEVVYILDGEIKETLPATIEEGYLVFETTHLSEYGVIAENVKEETINNPKTGDNIGIAIALFTIATLGLATTIKMRRK